jgi:hypothetical protein
MWGRNRWATARWAIGATSITYRGNVGKIITVVLDIPVFQAVANIARVTTIANIQIL